MFIWVRAGVGNEEVVVRRNHGADLVQRIDAGLAGEDVVLVDLGMNPRVAHQTESPQARSASRPSSLNRADVHGGSQTTSSSTSSMPGSASNRSRMSPMIMSLAGQPIAVNVRLTQTRRSSTVSP